MVSVPTKPDSILMVLLKVLNPYAAGGYFGQYKIMLKSCSVLWNDTSTSYQHLLTGVNPRCVVTILFKDFSNFDIHNILFNTLTYRVKGDKRTCHSGSYKFICTVSNKFANWCQALAGRKQFSGLDLNLSCFTKSIV